MNFLIDEKVTIGSILEALKVEGVKTSDVAKAIDGISEKPLRKALKEAGYEFQNKVPKGWHYIGEGEQPLNSSIFDYVNKSNTKMNKGNTKVNKSNTHVNSSNKKVNKSNTHVNESNTEVNDVSSTVIQGNTDVNDGNTGVNVTSHEVVQSNTDVNVFSPVVHPQFTQDEIADIVEMLHEWRVKKAAEKLGIQKPKKVFERIKALPQGDKVRKTIVIDRGIGQRLDEYCQAEKLNKSDVLHIALMDFLARYDK